MGINEKDIYIEGMIICKSNGPCYLHAAITGVEELLHMLYITHTAHGRLSFVADQMMHDFPETRRLLK